MTKTKENLEKFIEQNMTHTRADDYLKFFSETPAEYSPIFLKINFGDILRIELNGYNVPVSDAINHYLAAEAIKKGCKYVTDIKYTSNRACLNGAYGTGLIKK